MNAASQKAVFKALPQASSVKFAPVDNEGYVCPPEVGEYAHEHFPHEALTIGESSQQRILILVFESSALAVSYDSGQWSEGGACEDVPLSCQIVRA